MSEPGDDHLSRAQSELGDPEAFFQISRGRYVAKLWAGLGLIVGSIIAIGVMAFFNLLFDILLIAKIFLTPLAIGVAILWTMYRQRGLVVLVYPTGLLRLQRGEVDSFPWDEISEIRVKIQRLESAEIIFDAEGNPVSCWLPVEVPSVQIWKSSVAVERADGNEAYFGPALAEYDRLAELIQRRTFPRAWVDARDRLLSGETVAFGDLEASPNGLKHGAKLLRWRDLKDLTIAQGRLSIKRAGGWLPWTVLDASKIPNPHVLFALVGEAKRFFKNPAPSQPQTDDKDQRAEETGE